MNKPQLQQDKLQEADDKHSDQLPLSQQKQPSQSSLQEHQKDSSLHHLNNGILPCKNTKNTGNSSPAKTSGRAHSPSNINAQSAAKNNSVNTNKTSSSNLNHNPNRENISSSQQKELPQPQLTKQQHKQQIQQQQQPHIQQIPNHKSIKSELQADKSPVSANLKNQVSSEPAQVSSNFASSVSCFIF